VETKVNTPFRVLKDVWQGEDYNQGSFFLVNWMRGKISSVVVFDKASVKVCEADKSLDVLNASRGRLVLDDVDFLSIHLDILWA